MDFEKMIAYRNERNLFARRLGIYIEALSLGYARVVKTVEENDNNSLNVPHGGIYFTMADNACGSAMATHGYTAVTLSANYNFFRSARVGDRLAAEAEEVKTGKTICVYEARITDQNGTLLGTGTFTFYRLDQKLEV